MLACSAFFKPSQIAIMLGRCIIFGAFLNAFALAVSTQFDRASAQNLLEGQVEHSVSLPAVSSKWKKGAKFDMRKLPNTGSHAVVWWRVPDWLAGSWKNAGKVKRLSVKDVEKGEISRGFSAVDVNYPDTEVIGYQQDRDGSVWTCVPTPYVGRTEQTEQINVSIIHSVTPVAVSSKEVVIKFLATTLGVDKKTGKVIHVSQRESLQTYRPIEQGRVLVQASMKFFDEDGKATYESQVLSQCRLQETYKESPFVPAPGTEPTLIDMRKSFDHYLHLQQLDVLIPERAPVPPPPGYKLVTLD